MPIMPVAAVADPAVALYRNLSDAELLRRHGLFIAEGRLVVRRLIAESSLTTVSVLVTPTALDSLRDLLERPEHRALPVYVCDLSQVQAITGFNLHRGCLAIGKRPPTLDVASVVASPVASEPIVVLEGVGNADNVGAIFRSAFAFGARGVVVGPGCCDPLYRKAIRVSMGACLRLPFAIAGGWPHELDRIASAGYTIVALTPARDAIDLERFATMVNRSPLALVLGSEGGGLSDEAIAAAGVRVRIPIVEQADSLNVASAAAVALYRLGSVNGAPGQGGGAAP